MAPTHLTKPRKVLVLGSGGLKIGEAGEFDYSGSQCLKALKEEGITTVLINPNIATIQTSTGMAEAIYFLPVQPHFVEQTIAKERPDALMMSFGGQTALNCGVALAKSGVLEKYGVRILGPPLSAVEDTEDRERFVHRLTEIGLKAPRSKAAYTIEDAKAAALELGYPVMIRLAYALGGQGSGKVGNEPELVKKVHVAFSHSSQIPHSSPILIEEYLYGWKEIEYEVMRDAYDNCITVCNMENLDPLGIHTGESIVVAPSQTLSDQEYHQLREISIRAIRHLQIIGECNIQFAVHPRTGDYRIIEVNARLSRSSALASKATGYPLAFIASKVSLGYSLAELPNLANSITTACFEPALDYVVVKIPRWDLQKFRQAHRRIGSQMKSVGEVMAIGRKFEEALQKALRMTGTGLPGLIGNNNGQSQFDNIDEELRSPTDRRILATAEAFRRGSRLDYIQALTHIDPWFLSKIQNIVRMQRQLETQVLETVPPSLLRQAKRLGFSDQQLGTLLCPRSLRNAEKEKLVRQRRKELGIIPFVKKIDTLAGEYPARSNYHYVTYNATHSDTINHHPKNVLVLGSGHYHIGSSVEFDWCCVTTVQALKKKGYSATIINYNPETVSTDYDVSDTLYFEELSVERVLDIYELERPLGIILSMGGQIPNKIAVELENGGATILGTSTRSIDMAENRHTFSALLDSLGISQPPWCEATSIVEVEEFAARVGYPVLIRPSYVLSGAAMSIALSPSELSRLLQKAADVSPEHPIVVSKFITDAQEIELDAVAAHGELMAHAISEHIENAGVHSGDATLVFPAQSLPPLTGDEIITVGKKIAHALRITGPFNIQFLLEEGVLRVIECNLRASRSFPFASKIAKRNLIELSTNAILNLPLASVGALTTSSYVGVKAPQFSFSRLEGADPLLGVEMASTGEVACLGKMVPEALLKSMLSVGFRVPQRGVLLSTGTLLEKKDLVESIRILHTLGLKLYATAGTALFLEEQGIPITKLYWPLEKQEPNVLTALKSSKVDLVINIPKNFEAEELTNDYIIRRQAVDLNIPLLTNAQLVKQIVAAFSSLDWKSLEIRKWEEY